MMRRGPWSALCALIIVVAACGDNLNKEAPGDAGVDSPVINSDQECGNGIKEGTEECDDGAASDTCSADCHLLCGNGVVDVDANETCDTAIAEGKPGACPTGCDDGDACTTDTLTNPQSCTAACLHDAITQPAAGDGCCPAGANNTTDTDCPAVCGNGVVESGETCDTNIAPGMPGACPTSCDDGASCTVDNLAGAMCTQTCEHVTITDPADGDGCCPTGANAGNDDDCSATCGNGVVEPGETCDTGIAPGMTGACPTSCSDGNSCTTDVLNSGGTCNASCSNVAITQPANGDGCCPAGANANNDSDCPSVCGNTVTEPGEQCDDGNTNDNDGCTNACTFGPTAYRFNTLALRDPHVFLNFLGCHDVTNPPGFGNFSVNGAISDAITKDGDDADSFLDLSPTLVFRPLKQENGQITALDVYFADCTSPIGTTSCKPGATPPQAITATAQTPGTCLAPLAGTTHASYNPAITSSTSPCFASTPTTITLTLAGIPITLHDARVAATFSGSPANQLANGLLMGFISEADANAATLPADLPIIGGNPLSSLLAGGSGACPSYSDKDINNGVVGWWFYLNFTAPKAPWSEN